MHIPGLSSGAETLLIFQLVLVIAAIGQYLPLSINQLDIAIPGYMAIGAYASAVLTTNFGAPFAPALIAGALLATILGLGIDYLAARTKAKGFAFAIITIAFFSIVQVILLNLAYVGGAGGFRGIPLYSNAGVVLLVLALVLVFVLALDNSYLGRAMRAIRDDELAAEAMGVNLLATKLFVFGAGAFIGGLAGGLYAHYALYLFPNYFSFGLLIAIQLPIVFGGLQTVWGTIFGTLPLGLLPEFVRGLAHYRLLFTATLTVVVILLRPQGIITRAMIESVGRWALRSR